MNKYDLKKLITKTPEDKIQFALILGCIGNLIGFSNGQHISSKSTDKYYSELLIFRFIN